MGYFLLFNVNDVLLCFFNYELDMCWKWGDEYGGGGGGGDGGDVGFFFVFSCCIEMFISWWKL